VAGALLLLPLGLLLMGIGALLLLLTDGPPVLYRQERVGRGGRPFRLYKLRTMVRDAEARTGPVWSTADDPRTTRMGRRLRSTRLDELPQLFNVLRGDMSLVGPRPERPSFVHYLLNRVPDYGQRLLLRPGMTGWSQVHGQHDQSLADVYEQLRYDLFYLRHVSFWLDLRLLLATNGVVLSRRGAH
jgi:lipopolysaccharide/colanic/teichoic acid biosynthesis glycosyltransferase